jgi:prepilin-type N-terminal cleavage/methylation domain-containing protein
MAIAHVWRTRRRARALGFTLVELLVVVSIITLLLGILLPSLSRAREKARITKCLSNLRQISSAMHYYFGEYNDIFPWFSNYEYGRGALSPQYNFYGGRYPRYDDVGSGFPLFDWKILPEERPFNHYLYPGIAGKKAEAPVYLCPSDGRFDPYPWDQAIRIRAKVYDLMGTSYWHNYAWIHLGDVLNWGLLPDYANQLTRYKLNVRGAGTFVTLSTVPLYAMWNLYKAPKLGVHGELGMDEVLFLDGHADYLLMNVWSDNTKMGTSAWTLWFSEPLSDIPPQFRPPFPGIRDWQRP